MGFYVTNTGASLNLRRDSSYRAGADRKQRRNQYVTKFPSIYITGSTVTIIAGTDLTINTYAGEAITGTTTSPGVAVSLYAGYAL